MASARQAANQPVVMREPMLIAIVGVGFFVSQLSMTTAPYYVGAILRERSWAETTGGALFLVEMLTFGVAMLASGWLLSRSSPRRLAVAGVILIALGQVLSIFAPSSAVLFGCRMGTGIGSALVNVASAAIAARSVVPARIYGAANALLTLLCAGLYVGSGFASGVGGSAAIFLMLALLALLSGPLMATMPSIPTVDAERARKTDRLGVGLVALAALIIFNTGVNAIWPFLEHLTSSVGISVQRFSILQSVASVIAVAGGVIASVVGTRFGRLRPLAISLPLVGVAAIWMTSIRSGTEFLLAETLFLSAWYFVYTYILDVAAEVDPSGRTVALTAAGLPLSLGLGAVLGGTIIDHFDFRTVGLCGLAATLVALLLIAPVAHRIDRRR